MNSKKNNNRTNYKNHHILAKGHYTSTDTWETGINNNVLIFGPSGAGKTRHYVKPNILNSHESMIISDTKGSLYAELAPSLRKRGFIVKNIDFTNLSTGSGYNPLNFIRRNPKTNEVKMADVMSLARCIAKDESSNDPFWHNAARQYLSCLIGYVMEALPEEEHTLEYVIKLFNSMDTDEFQKMMHEFVTVNPENSISTKYLSIAGNEKAEKMHQSIKGILSAYMDPLCFDEALALYKNPDVIDFASLGKKKTAVFLTISDIDRSMDPLANAFMTQALQVLLRSADNDYPDHRLPIPVRLYLDDFATNLYIPDFDKIISVVRSREISVSIILQSITQLYSLYGDARAKTILNNCDQQLYLGGQDVDTARYISIKANKPIHTILSMPLNHAYLFIRGQRPISTEKYNIQEFEKEMSQIQSEPELA